MKKIDAEVIVAGAGPSGAVAARTLAAAGVETLLIDRAHFPRNKPCGGGLTSRALTRFPWLNAALGDVDVHRIAKLHLEGPHGAVLTLEHSSTCVLLVRRIEFDHALVQAATAAGARLATGFEIAQVQQDADGVTLQSRDGRTLRARWVIATDGVHSVIAKRTGINTRWPRTHVAIDMMEETPVETLAATRPDVLWVAYAYDGLDGYSYIFPKTRHVNVGIGCLLSHFDEHVDTAPYALQKRFVERLVQRGDLTGVSDRSRFTPFLIPVGGPLPRAACGRVLFAGDAGGFVHAITAEGIYYAMASGELAGKAIADTLREARPETTAGRYERMWRAELGAELSDGVRLQRHLFSSHERLARLIRSAARLPGLSDSILDFVTGDLSYASLRRRMIFRFPLAMWRLARSMRSMRASA